MPGGPLARGIDQALGHASNVIHTQILPAVDRLRPVAVTTTSLPSVVASGISGTVVNADGETIATTDQPLPKGVWLVSADLQVGWTSTPGVITYQFSDGNSTAFGAGTQYSGGITPAFTYVSNGTNPNDKVTASLEALSEAFDSRHIQLTAVNIGSIAT